MNLPARQCAALTFAAAAGLYLACCPRPPEPNDPPDADRIEPLSDVVHLRTHAKARIVREVIDGRRPLLEAAALFRELDRLPPAADVWLGHIPVHLPTPTGTEEERYCQLVAVWVSSRAAAQSPGDGSAGERAAAAVARLVAEFEDELARRGAIRLPDPSALESAEVLIERARADCGKAKRP